ncbi:uncharacterized protein LOC135393833 isoform X2 [Ornithodoros turicata]|uniref:uncharacterized protein LOC135393833 isoform X2 n=1 Tax=Ornithodoros turicata TaxID=34597 RepID=UPI003139AE75
MPGCSFLVWPPHRKSSDHCLRNGSVVIRTKPDLHDVAAMLSLTAAKDLSLTHENDFYRRQNHALLRGPPRKSSSLISDLGAYRTFQFTAERTDRDFLIHLWCQNYTKAFYKGFLFRAIQKKGRTESYFNGHFIRDTRSPDVRFVRCDDTPDSAVTHIDSSRKNETYVRWVPHERPFHPVVVVFRATIVQQRVIYWMGVDTKVVLVGSASSSTSTWILFIIVPLSARLFKTYYC